MRGWKLVYVDLFGVRSGAGIVTAKIDEQKTDATREKILELVKKL